MAGDRLIRGKNTKTVELFFIALSPGIPLSFPVMSTGKTESLLSQWFRRVWNEEDPSAMTELAATELAAHGLVTTITGAKTQLTARAGRSEKFPGASQRSEDGFLRG